ncbi:MAG: hypothetical protein RR673_07430 [Erysipelotrichaceae bacterium]
MNITGLAFKDKEALLGQVGRMYRRSKLRNRLCDDFKVREDPNAYINLEVAKEIDTILECMSELNAHIIKEEFLKERKRSWWQKTYSDSQYFQHKNNAMDEFLDCLYT